MDSYESYLNHAAGNTLPVEEALQIYNDLYESVSKCKCEDLPEFVDEFLLNACNYCNIRNAWQFWTREEKMDNDSMRTAKHNVVIDSINILARLLNSEGVDTPWRDQLGDNRKRIGDFACFVAYMVGINNR